MPNFADIKLGMSTLTPEEQAQLLAEHPELKYDENEIRNNLLPNMPDEDKNIVFEKYPDLRPEAGWVETVASTVPAAFAQSEVGIGGALQTLGDVTGLTSISSIGEPGVTEGQRALKQIETQQNLPPESWKRTIRDAGTSAVSNLAKIPLAAVNPALALGVMGVESGGIEAAQAKEEGATPLQAAARGVGFGALEAIGEAVPIGSVMDMLAPTAVKKTIGNMAIDLAKYIGKELAGEEVTAIGQVGIDLMQKNPNMTMAEFKQTLKDTALQTIISAPLIGGGATVLGKIGQIGAKQTAPTLAPEVQQQIKDEQNAITTLTDEEIAQQAKQYLETEAQPEIISQGTPQTVVEPPAVENIPTPEQVAPEAIKTPVINETPKQEEIIVKTIPEIVAEKKSEGLKGEELLNSVREEVAIQKEVAKQEQPTRTVQYNAPEQTPAPFNVERIQPSQNIASAIADMRKSGMNGAEIVDAVKKMKEQATPQGIARFTEEELKNPTIYNSIRREADAMATEKAGIKEQTNKFGKKYVPEITKEQQSNYQFFVDNFKQNIIDGTFPEISKKVREYADNDAKDTAALKAENDKYNDPNYQPKTVQEQIDEGRKQTPTAPPENLATGQETSITEESKLQLVAEEPVTSNVQVKTPKRTATKEKMTYEDRMRNENESQNYVRNTVNKHNELRKEISAIDQEIKNKEMILTSQLKRLPDGKKNPEAIKLVDDYNNWRLKQLELRDTKNKEYNELGLQRAQAKTKPITDKYFIGKTNSFTKKVTFEEVPSAKPFKVDGRPDLDLFSHKDGKDFIISEGRTGLAVGKGKTLAEAAEKVYLNLDRINKGIENTIAQGTESRRYIQTEDMEVKFKDNASGDYLAVPLNKPPVNQALVGFLQGLNQTDLVRLIEELDAVPSVKAKFRKDGVLGAFYQKDGGKIQINAMLGKVDADTLAKVIAHEIGHLVDWKEGAVNNTLRRGNLLGHIIAQAKFFKSAVNLDPTGTPRMIDNKQRQKLYSQARKTVEKSALYYEQDLDQRLVSQEYRRLLSEYIDDNNLIENEVAKAELLNFTQAWWNLTDEQMNEQIDYLSKPSELYANAFSAFLTNPQALHTSAPTVAKMIYDYMTVEKPEFYAVYRDMQNKIATGANDRENIQWLDTRIKEATDTRIQDLIKRRPDESLMESVKRQYFDSLSALQALAKKSGKLDTKFLETVENFRNYKDITEGFIERFFPDVVNDLAKQGLNLDDLKVPAFLKRIIGERGGKVIDVVSKEYADKLNREFNSKLTPEQITAINNSFVKLWENRQPLLNEIKDLGVFSDELMTYILNNKDYFTWDVVKKVDDTIGKKSPGTSAIIKKQIGAFSAVANPYTSTILKDFSLIKFAKKQALVKATLAKLNELGMTVKEAQKKFKNGFWEFQEPNPNTGLALVTVMEKGEVKGYYVEQGIATALENKPVEMSAAAKVMSIINRPIRASLTSANPVFIFGMNPIRDTVAAFLNMPYALRNFGTWSKLMAKEFAKAMPIINGLTETEADRQYKYKMRSEGKLLGEREAVGDPALIKSEEDLLKSFYSSHADLTDFEKAINKFTGFFSLIDMIRNAGKRIEQAPKIAANKFYEQIKDKYDLTEADISYFVRNFAGSPDFRRKGAHYGDYNNFFMYSNAMKEGYRATAEAAKYSPKEFALKALGLSLTPVLLTLLGEANDPEWWDKVSEYNKTNYMIVPMGYDDNQKPVFLRLPMTEAVRFFAAGTRKIIKGATGDIDIKQALGNMIAIGADEIPTAGPAVQTLGVLGQYLAGQNPYDFFRGREILSAREYALRRAKPEEAAGTLLKHIWNTNGGGTWYKFHPEYDKLEKSDIEKLSKMPVFGMNILGSFIKTGYDKPLDKQKEMDFKIKEAAALGNTLIDSLIEKTVEGRASEVTPEERAAKRANPEYFKSKIKDAVRPEARRAREEKLRQKNLKKYGLK